MIPFDPPAATADAHDGSGRGGIPRLPLRAGVVVCSGFLVQLLATWTLLHVAPDGWRLPLALATIVGQYLVIFVLCRVVSRQWGSGSVGRDLGLQLRRADLNHGVVGWLGGMGAVAIAGWLLRRLQVPLVSNSPLAGSGRTAVTLPQWLAIGVIGLVMLVAAPFFEELLFRGVLLRALSGVLPAPIAVVVQGVVFAAFHLDPDRGAANIGLLAVLSVVGVMLGIVAHRCHGRLGGSMFAHSLHNGLAFAVGLAALR